MLDLKYFYATMDVEDYFTVLTGGSVLFQQRIGKTSYLSRRPKSTEKVSLGNAEPNRTSTIFV